MNQRNMGSVVAGASLIVLGGLFLMSQLLRISIWQFLWPLFVIIPGIAMFVGVYSGGKQAAGLAIPASVVSTVGSILLFQSITNHWESWAYAWSLIFPTAVGLGMYIFGSRADDEDTRQRGRGMIRTGIIIFVLLGVFFESIFAFGGSLFGRILWPVAIIALGVYLILRQSGVISASGKTTKASVDITPEEVPSVHGDEEASEEE
jgi:hypothetical protein